MINCADVDVAVDGREDRVVDKGAEGVVGNGGDDNEAADKGEKLCATRNGGGGIGGNRPANAHNRPANAHNSKDKQATRRRQSADPCAGLWGGGSPGTDSFVTQAVTSLVASLTLSAALQDVLATGGTML